MNKLGICSAEGCENIIDPRWYAHDGNGGTAPICDGHDTCVTKRDQNIGPCICPKMKEPKRDSAELDFTDSPRCPHCWYLHPDDHYEIFDEGVHELSCSRCGEDFDVETSISRSFSTKKTTDEDFYSGGS